MAIDNGKSAHQRGAETLHPLHVDRRRFEAAGRGASIACAGRLRSGFRRELITTLVPTMVRF
ncbi:MAG: hypothetical protein ACREO3_04115 [Arenimonas sp.]